MRWQLAAVCAVGALSVAAAQPADEAYLRRLFDEHQWFALRDAVAGRAVVAPLYRGAVAAAFNRTSEAEVLLGRAIREAASPAAANDAREVLAGMYMRLSRSADMVRVLDAMLAAAPDRADVRNVRDGFDAFRHIKNQTAHLDRRPFACAVRADGVTLSATVDGTAVQWLFDSGFSQSALSDGEARALGIRIDGAAMSSGDVAATTRNRAAVADRLRIGKSELRHVPVLVFPDAHPMWIGRPRGRQGTIALPVAIALGGIGWTRDGQCRFGPAPATASRPNLAFDSNSPPVTTAIVRGQPIEVSLDTGAQAGTQLWRRFAIDFPDLIAAGVRTSTEVREIGGARAEDTVTMPVLPLTIAGFAATLRPARVLPASPGDGFHHGNAGMDLFSQASAVTFDFQRMTIELR